MLLLILMFHKIFHPRGINHQVSDRQRQILKVENFLKVSNIRKSFEAVLQSPGMPSS